MIYHNSQFRDFCEKGDVTPKNWSKVKGYVITDTDHWIEILTLEKPKIKVTVE